MSRISNKAYNLLKYLKNAEIRSEVEVLIDNEYRYGNKEHFDSEANDALIIAAIARDRDFINQYPVVIDVLKYGNKRKREDSELSDLELMPSEMLDYVCRFLSYQDLKNLAATSQFMLFNAKHNLRIESQKWQAFHVFKNHTIGIKFNGDVFVCGNNLRGFIGAGDDVDAQRELMIIPRLKNIKSISASEVHTVFVDADGAIWVCGANESGRLGLTERTSKRSVALVPNLKNVNKAIVNEGATFVLFNNGSVSSCGNNRYGKLGHGVVDQDAIFEFQPIHHLGAVEDIVVGKQNTFFLMRDGGIEVCGMNASFQLGLGDCVTRYVITRIPELSNVKEIIPADFSTFFLMKDGTVKISDINHHIPTTIVDLDNVKQVVAKSSHAFFLLNNGTVKVYGSNFFGQIGLGGALFFSGFVLLPGVSHVKEIIAHTQHTFFLLQNGEVMACGFNEYGQLGLDVLLLQTAPILIPGLVNIKKIFTSEKHTLFLTFDNKVLGCGNNKYGQLGLGSDIKVQPTPIELNAKTIRNTLKL